MSPSPKHSLLAGQFVHDLLGVVDEVLAKDLAKCFDKIESDALGRAAKAAEERARLFDTMYKCHQVARDANASLGALRAAEDIRLLRDTPGVTQGFWDWADGREKAADAIARDLRAEAARIERRKGR